jgi:two-component system response regulator AtoC
MADEPCMALRVLVACADRRDLTDLEVRLAGERYEVFCAEHAEVARELANRSVPEVILWGLEDRDDAPGPVSIARSLSGAYLAAVGRDTALLARRLEQPAFLDALELPCTAGALRLAMRRARVWCRLERENRLLARQVAESAAERPIVAASPRMIELLEALERAAGLRACVLLRGERGTGKEGLARAIHAQSDRRAGPFVSVQCRIPDERALVAELFGRAGGAEPPIAGAFALADGGTLYLDEVDALPPGCQERLLDVLEAEAVSPSGTDKPRRVDVRIVSSCALDPGERPLREDLFLRLAGVELPVPPLRERAEDIPLLLDHFAFRASRSLGLPRPSVGDDALERLLQHSWPGNVREFENVVERCVRSAGGARITARELPELRGAEGDGVLLTLRPARKRLEQDLIRRALRRTGGNRTHAAKVLGISHRALLYKLKEYGITS